MSFLSKIFKRKSDQDKPATEVEKPDQREIVEKGGEFRISVETNDGARLAIIKTYYVKGKQPKTGSIDVDETFASYVSKDGVYGKEIIEGKIDIGAQSENGAKTIKILSFTQNPIDIGVPVTVRIPGQELGGTVRADVFLDGDAKKLDGLLGGSESKEQVRGGVLCEKYITARELQEIVKQSVESITTRTVNFSEVYESREEIDAELSKKISNHTWFMDRGLSVRTVFIEFEMSELEKIKDKVARVKLMTADQKAELEGKKANVKMAEENKKLMSSVDNTPEEDGSEDIESAKKPEQI